MGCGYGVFLWDKQYRLSDADENVYRFDKYGQ